MNKISQNVARIRHNIAEAAIKSGRKPEDIKLVGVTKYMDIETMKILHAAGITDFGESRVQDFLPKREAFASEPIDWHFIGHLQTNKVKSVVGNAKLIHSVDSVRLAEEISRRAVLLDTTVDFLAEINIADEDSKYGLKSTELSIFISTVSHLPRIKLRGLMCIAPFVENGEKNRPFFEKMRNLLIDTGLEKEHNTPQLSMGMSQDYVCAISAGATIVRIGTSLIE